MLIAGFFIVNTYLHSADFVKKEIASVDTLPVHRYIFPVIDLLSTKGYQVALIGNRCHCAYKFICSKDSQPYTFHIEHQDFEGDFISWVTILRQFRDVTYSTRYNLPYDESDSFFDYDIVMGIINKLE